MKRRRNVESVEDIESVEDARFREKNERRSKTRLALILCLVSLMAFTIWLISISPLPSDNENRGVAESFEENGEITHSTEENATAGQDLRHLAVDEDGGYWVIEALLVPEEWK